MHVRVDQAEELDLFARILQQARHLESDETTKRVPTME